MRSNAVQKDEFFTVQHIGVTAGDNVVEFSEAWEIRRARIAQAAQDATNLPGNLYGCDLEDFAAQYGIGSSFA